MEKDGCAKLMEGHEIWLRKGKEQEVDQLFIEYRGGLVPVHDNLDHYPSGIKSYALSAGVKEDGILDFTVIKMDKPGIAAAMYTTSLCASPAVTFDRPNTDAGSIELLCVISKNANVFTGTDREDLEEVASLLSEEFQVPRNRLMLSCTGVIGMPLPMGRIRRAIQGGRERLKLGDLPRSSEAILTTDMRTKVASIRLEDMVLCGFAKGAGMIEPNMATMLAYFFTNFPVDKRRLDKMLRKAVDLSFNSITVDSDTSTSDTVAIISTGEGAAQLPTAEEFERGLTALCIKLAREVVMGAEGATKLLQVECAVDTSSEDAKIIGKKIANSPLVKSAVHGADPNWGRLVMAVGKPTPRTQLDSIAPHELEITVMGHAVWDKGKAVKPDLSQIAQKMRCAKHVTIRVTIGSGRYMAACWSSDLSEEYVTSNADYTS